MEKELEVIKIVQKGKTYTDSKGKERTRVNYYLSYNGNLIAIRPCFAKGYIQIDTFAKLVVNGIKDAK